ncbi:MAG: nucleoside 2-deoxyribosyltransferase [bacterium]|nr:nucleoside 2-deoxyribosyltransferase [bacterium]
MRIFFSGPLTNLADPDKTKAFYARLADQVKALGFDYFWAFQNGTDPVKNREVAPQDVYRRDIEELSQSDLMLSYVGEPSTGTGIEIEYAYAHNIPVYLLYEQGKKISRMLRGCPGIKGEVVFIDEADALSQLASLLTDIKRVFA